MKDSENIHPAEKRRTRALVNIGWREWVGFPKWGLDSIKAKIDTGARTSSLHADELNLYRDGEIQMVRFVIHPWQSSTEDAVEVEAPVLSLRHVKSSSGQEEERPVIMATMFVGGVSFDAELTLTNRDSMGFRMLLGREALRGRFQVNPGRSYIGGRPSMAIRRKNRGRSS